MTVQDGGYRRGGFWRIDARSGFKVRGDQTMQEWTGSYVAREDFERRQPQDFVRGVGDRQIVPDARPRAPVDTFIGPLVTALTVAGKAGDTTINVESSARFANGDQITVLLDNGTLLTTVAAIPSATSIQIAAALTGPATIGNQVIDRSAVAAANLG